MEHTFGGIFFWCCGICWVTDVYIYTRLTFNKFIHDLSLMRIICQCKKKKRRKYVEKKYHPYHSNWHPKMYLKLYIIYSKAWKCMNKIHEIVNFQDISTQKEKAKKSSKKNVIYLYFLYTLWKHSKTWNLTLCVLRCFHNTI